MIFKVFSRIILKAPPNFSLCFALALSQLFLLSTQLSAGCFQLIMGPKRGHGSSISVELSLEIMKFGNNFCLLRNWKLLILWMPFPGRPGCLPSLFPLGSLRCLGFKCCCVLSLDKSWHCLPSCELHSYGSCSCWSCFDFGWISLEAAIWHSRVLCSVVLCLAHQRLWLWLFLDHWNQNVCEILLFVLCCES